MKVTQFGSLYQVTFLHRIFPVNCYIIEEDNSITLIDASLPYCANKILSVARKIDKPIERILITHAHNDHIGALEKLRRLLPDAKIYISERDNRLLMGDRSLDPKEPQNPLKGSIPKERKINADLFIKDGDRIGSLLAISAPGHTPGLFTFLDTRSNAIVVGDAFQVRGGVAVAGEIVPLFPFPGLATWNKTLSLESAEKLLELKPSLLATGHGNMLENPTESMKKAILKAKANQKMHR